MSQPALAQEEVTPEAAMASVIQAALAPDSYGDWRYNWDAVSIRISSKMHWHLAGPDKPDTGDIIRRGWISAKGIQIGVTAAGQNETVSSLSFEVKSWPRDSDEQTSLLAALADKGVKVVETGRRAPPDLYYTDIPVIAYRLSAPDRDDGVLTRHFYCTPPGSAAARRCTTTYELELGGE